MSGGGPEDKRVQWFCQRAWTNEAFLGKVAMPWAGGGLYSGDIKWSKAANHGWPANDSKSFVQVQNPGQVFSKELTSEQTLMFSTFG